MARLHPIAHGSSVANTGNTGAKGTVIMANEKPAEKPAEKAAEKPALPTSFALAPTELVANIVTTRKPAMADATLELAEKYKATMLEKPGEKVVSEFYLYEPPVTAAMLRSAFKFHGLAVGFGETKEDTPRTVFRIIGVFETREEKKERKAAEEAAKAEEKAADAPAA